MFCPSCGTENDDNAYRCVKCGIVLQQAAGPSAPPQRVPNYLVQSILVTLFCCLPLGIAAIVYSAQVNAKLQAGDVAGALHASKQARTFGWISFGVGLLIGVVYLLAVIGGAAGR
jgi:hypothetical protein